MPVKRSVKHATRVVVLGVMVTLIAGFLKWAANGTWNYYGRPVVASITDTIKRQFRDAKGSAFHDPNFAANEDGIPPNTSSLETGSLQPLPMPDAAPSVPATKQTKRKLQPLGFFTDFAMEIGLVIDTLFGTVAYRDEAARDK